MAFVNPTPLGLSGSGLTTFVLSMFNAHVRGMETPNVIVGLTIFYGEIAQQLIAGIGEIALENTFDDSVLCFIGWVSGYHLNLYIFNGLVSLTHTLVNQIKKEKKKNYKML